MVIVLLALRLNPYILSILRNLSLDLSTYCLSDDFNIVLRKLDFLDHLLSNSEGSVLPDIKVKHHFLEGIVLRKLNLESQTYLITILPMLLN